jgi:hypothetical protein
VRVRDGSCLRRHFAARVWIGSNGAQGFDAHVRWCAARSGGANAWVAGAIGWMDACAREVAAKLRGSYGGNSESDRRKKKGEWGQPRPEPVYL